MASDGSLPSFDQLDHHFNLSRLPPPPPAKNAHLLDSQNRHETAHRTLSRTRTTMPPKPAKRKIAKKRRKAAPSKAKAAGARRAQAARRKSKRAEDDAGWDSDAGRELGARISKDVGDVLKGVKEIKEQMRKDKRPQQTLASLQLAQRYREVVDKGTRSVMHQIEKLIANVASSVLAGAGLTYQVPSRSAHNQAYIAELDRIVLKESESARRFGDRSAVRKVTIMSRLMDLVVSALSQPARDRTHARTHTGVPPSATSSDERAPPHRSHRSHRSPS